MSVRDVGNNPHYIMYVRVTLKIYGGEERPGEDIQMNEPGSCYYAIIGFTTKQAELLEINK